MGEGFKAMTEKFVEWFILELAGFVQKRLDGTYARPATKHAARIRIGSRLPASFTLIDPQSGQGESSEPKSSIWLDRTDGDLVIRRSRDAGEQHFKVIPTSPQPYSYRIEDGKGKIVYMGELAKQISYPIFPDGRDPA